MTEVSTEVPQVLGDAHLFDRWLMGQTRGATEDWCDRCQNQLPMNLLATSESPFSLCRKFVPGAQGGCASYEVRAKK